MTRLMQRIACLFGMHDWTSAAAKGERPTDEQLKAGVAGFWQYARMYCGACGKNSELNP